MLQALIDKWSSADLLSTDMPPLMFKSTSRTRNYFVIATGKKAFSAHPG